MRISLIAAVSDNGVIGRGGALPWRLPADLARFKRLTTGHTIVMGRRTWESIGRPLPDRRHLVLTHRAGWSAPGVERAASLDEAIDRARRAGESELFVIGGGAVYAEALGRADRLLLTRVRAEVDGDAWFPEVDWARWRLVEREARAADERHAFAMRFEAYDRV